MAGRFSVEAVFKATDRVTAPVSRMQSRIGKMTRGATRNLKKLNRTLNKFIGGLGRAGKKALAFAGGAVLIGVTAVAIALNKTADAADRLAKQSRRLQFPIEELQEWKFVAEQSGVSNELLDKSLGAFTKRLGEAKGGVGPLVSGLKKINPELLKQLQSTDDVSKAFSMYINAMRKADTATEKAALANAAFSRSGLELVNIADNSATAINALMLEQRANGNITKQQAEAAEKYNDAVNSLKRSLMGLMQGILLPMLPAITKTVKAWREWVIVNKEAINKKILEFFQQMKTRIKEFIEKVKELNKEHSFLKKIEDAFRKIGDTIDYLFENGKTILKITAWIAGLVVGLKVLIGVLTLVNLVMSANPISLIVIGIIAAIAAFTSLVVWIDDVAAAFSNMNPFVRALLLPLEAIVRTIKFIKDGFSGGFGSAISKLGVSLGFGGDENEKSGSSGAQVISPQERTAKSIEEKRTKSTAEVTIKDDTGRAEVTSGSLGTGLSLMSSGAF
tara:strand:- start:26806 stop:28317 length:1512 start_codon:yes stop_codon:yes gene_type:complete